MERTPEMTQRRLPRYQRRSLSLSVLFVAISVVAASPPAKTLTGKVVKIADGDTLTLLVGKTQIKVRLEGIDTPERAQPFGRKAGQALAKKVFGKVIQVDDLGKDRYGRTLGTVRLDTRNVNLELVRVVVPEVRPEEQGAGFSGSSGPEGEAGFVGRCKADPTVGLAAE